MLHCAGRCFTPPPVSTRALAGDIHNTGQANTRGHICKHTRAHLQICTQVALVFAPLDNAWTRCNGQHGCRLHVCAQHGCRCAKTYCSESWARRVRRTQAQAAWQTRRCRRQSHPRVAMLACTRTRTPRRAPLLRPWLPRASSAPLVSQRPPRHFRWPHRCLRAALLWETMATSTCQAHSRGWTESGRRRRSKGSGRECAPGAYALQPPTLTDWMRATLETAVATRLVSRLPAPRAHPSSFA